MRLIHASALATAVGIRRAPLAKFNSSAWSAVLSPEASSAILEIEKLQQGLDVGVECGLTLVICNICSLTVALASAFLGVYTSGLVSLSCTFAAITVSHSWEAHQGWAHSSPGSSTCKALLIWEFTSLSIWLAVLVPVLVPCVRKIFVCCVPSLDWYMDRRWKKLLLSMPGPSKELYESFFYRGLCETATSEASVAGHLSMRGFRRAVANLVHDPDWLEADWCLRLIVALDDEEAIPPHSAAHLLMQTCAYIIETKGCGVPGLQNFRILSIAEPAKVTPTQIDQIMDKMLSQWHPSKRPGVSQMRSLQDFTFLVQAYNEVKEHVSCKQKQQSSL